MSGTFRDVGVVNLDRRRLLSTTAKRIAAVGAAWLVPTYPAGYQHYVEQGGDWGSPVTNEMGKLAPPELLM